MYPGDFFALLSSAFARCCCLKADVLFFNNKTGAWRNLVAYFAGHYKKINLIHLTFSNI